MRLNNECNTLLEKMKGSNLQNAAGFKVDITTLTSIRAEVIKQKFYTVAPADFMPVIVGENPFADEVLTYKTGQLGDDLEAGLMSPTSGNQRSDQANVEIEGVKVPIQYWRKDISYNIIELARATQSGNWSLIEAREESRMRAWQLLIQQAAFLGLVSNSGIKGLLTNSDVTTNTAVIPTNISAMTETQFETLASTILGAFDANCNSTARPTHFIMPTDDYLGMGVATSENFAIKSKLTRLKEIFIELTDNPNFKIAPLAYAKKENNTSFLGAGSGLNRYCLYNGADKGTVRMDIPNNITTTIFDTINGMDYQAAGYGGFGGAKFYRPLEAIYFDHSI